MPKDRFADIYDGLSQLASMTSGLMSFLTFINFHSLALEAAKVLS